MAKPTVKRLDEGQRDVIKMDLEQAMQEIFYHGFVFTLRPKKALEALKVIREALLDYIDLDAKLRTVNEENDELKRMLKKSLEALDAMAENVRDECGDAACGLCEYDSQLNEYGEMIYECEGVNGKTDCFKWRHHDEAMELLGGTENAEN